MNCMNCGASLPENARFCYSCGSAVPSVPGGAPGLPPPPPPPPTTSAPAPPSIAPAGAESMKCPSCGAPIHAVFGEMVITCDYCGGSVTLGGAGWKQIGKHTILPPKITDPAGAMRAVHDFLDTGFMHRKAFEESKVVEEKLSFIPFWVVPVSATTTFQYQDLAVGVGGTVASIAGAELLGAALGGRRGGFMPIPVMTGPPVNPTRAETIAGTFEFPVVAVKGMTNYQPKDYTFNLTERTFFDKKVIPNGAPVLNGDLGEDAAQHSARSYVSQLQAEQAHKKHHMVSQLQTSVELSEAELLHVPIFYFLLDRKGVKSMVLVDAHAGRVMQTVGA